MPADLDAMKALVGGYLTLAGAMLANGDVIYVNDDGAMCEPPAPTVAVYTATP